MLKYSISCQQDQTRHTEWYNMFKCECKFGANVRYNKQRWNKDTCRCQCKELIDKGVCDKGFIWNPSNCECECVRRVMFENI